MARFTGTLTSEQLAEVHAARDEWMARALSTSRCDRAAAEAAVRAAYRTAGIAEPQMVVWMDSPLGGAFAAAVLKHLLSNRGQLGGQLWGQLGDQLWGQFRGQLWGQLGGQLGGQLRGQLGDQLGGQLWDQLGGQLWGQLGGQLRGQLWDQLGDQLWGQLWGQFRGQLWGQLGDQLRGQLWDQLWDQLGDQLRGQLWDQLGDQLRGQLYTSLSPWYDAYWTVFYQRALAIADLPRSKRLDALATVHWLTSWWWPMAGAVVLTDRPTVLRRDDQGRLHCVDGPALAYVDGYELYAWRGVCCDQRIITGDLTAQDWLDEGNAELRRCIAERIGYEALLDAAQAQKVATDEYGTLWQIPDPGRTPNRGDERDTDEDVVLVDVLNSTPEPDGSIKRYVLRVPPQFAEPGSRPQDAIGWTFGLPPGTYQPVVMT